MSDELSLDHDTVAAQLAGPRRPPVERIGASQIAKMRLALGRRAWALGDVAYLRDETKVMRNGQSRAIAQAAGLVGPLKGGKDAKDEGTRREREVFSAWAALVREEWFTTGFESLLDPGSLEWRSSPPKEWPRRIDRHCPDLDTGGFDGFGRTRDGVLVNVEIKCARYKNDRAKSSLAVWWDRGECPWWYRDQLDAEMAIGGAQHSLLIVGGGWNRDGDDPRGDGPIRVFHVQRDDRRIADVRDIATTAMQRIRALKTSAADAA